MPSDGIASSSPALPFPIMAIVDINMAAHSKTAAAFFIN
jgi:hypothetical protein